MPPYEVVYAGYGVDHTPLAQRDDLGDALAEAASQRKLHPSWIWPAQRALIGVVDADDPERGWLCDIDLEDE